MSGRIGVLTLALALLTAACGDDGRVLGHRGDSDEANAYGPAADERLHPYPAESGFQRSTHEFEFNLPRVP